MTQRTFLPILLALALVLPAEARAQQTEVITIDGTPQCETCRVELDTIAVVGALADSVLIPDTDGGLVVVGGDTIVVGKTFGGPERNMVFAPDGTLVRTIGREGEGPGELLPFTAGIRPYDDTQVLVGQSGRLSVMDLSGEVLLERRFNKRMSTMISVNPDDGRMIYSYVQNPEGDAGTRYELLAPDLSSVRTFGHISLEEQSGCPLCRERHTAWSQSRPDHFWSLHRNRNHVELWSAEGEHVRTFQIEGAGWAPTLQDTVRRDPRIRDDGVFVAGAGPGGVGSAPPRPRFDWIYEDSEGLVWTTARVAAANWEPSPEPISPGGSDVEHTPEEWEYLARQFDTVIQIIDPEAREVVAVWRNPNRLMLRSTGGYYRIKSQNDLGVISYTVVRARLVR